MAWPADLGVAGYEMVRRLGINGAEVYLARHIATDRLVVLKVWSGHGESRVPDAELASVRLRHPNIVAVLDVGHAGAGAFSVLEWAPGGSTLAQRLQRPTMSPGEAAEIALAAANAVLHARERGMRLTRLSPAAVWLDDAGVPKMLPVFAEDALPSTSASDDLHQIGLLIVAMVKGQPEAGTWGALRTMGSRCLPEASAAPFASVEALASALASLIGDRAGESKRGPTRGCT